MGATAKILSAELHNGTIKEFDNQSRIYYDGYWIRHYYVPNNLAQKKRLIDQMARRVFHHTEHGINTPGDKVEEVREAYEKEANPSRKRVLAAMIAGALLNRGVDILTKIVELDEIGVPVESDNELVKICGRCFLGALEYGKYIRPIRGKEGLDELWGEPFKVFSMPIEQFYETRYIKIAQTMSNIDSLAKKMTALFNKAPGFEHLEEKLKELAECSKQVVETMRSDPAMIDIWPRFVSAADDLDEFRPVYHEGATNFEKAMGRRGKELISAGTDLMIDMTNMRIPLPKSTQAFMQKCNDFSKKYNSRLNR